MPPLPLAAGCIGAGLAATLTTFALLQTSAAAEPDAPPAEATVVVEEAPEYTQFKARRAAIAADDVPAMVELAKWAAEREMPAEANELCRAALERQPFNDEAYACLLTLVENQEPGPYSDAYRTARELLPERFQEYQTKRFIVISDAAPQWSIAQINRLERTDHQFHRFANRLGLRPLPLQNKLVCILFNSREDYQEFARVNDNVDDPWIGGYYSPRHDWVVFYYVEGNPSVAKARTKLAEMRHNIGLLQNSVRDAKKAGRGAEAKSIQHTLNQHEQHLKQQTGRVDAFAQQIAASTTTHEATHQLLFHARVQTPHVLYPLWISEGLATSFETDTPNNAFGPDHDYAPRREAFSRLLREDRLMPLATLIAITDAAGSSQNAVHQLYHQSYALVVWLCRVRQAQVRQYLETMLHFAAAGETTPDPLTVFEQCFGPTDKVEAEWLRDERAQLKK